MLKIISYKWDSLRLEKDLKRKIKKFTEDTEPAIMAETTIRFLRISKNLKNLKIQTWMRNCLAWDSFTA